MPDRARNFHKGYLKLVAWIKTKYGRRYRPISDPCQQKLVLEQVTTDDRCELPEITRKGFLACLENQNYKQVLMK
jgi:hypothetical protein